MLVCLDIYCFFDYLLVVQDLIAVWILMNILYGFSLVCLQHCFLTSAFIFLVKHKEILPALYYLNNWKVCQRGKPHSFQTSFSYQAESALFKKKKKGIMKKRMAKRRQHPSSTRSALLADHYLKGCVWRKEGGSWPAALQRWLREHPAPRGSAAQRSCSLPGHGSALFCL